MEDVVNRRVVCPDCLAEAGFDFNTGVSVLSITPYTRYCDICFSSRDGIRYVSKEDFNKIKDLV